LNNCTTIAAFVLVLTHLGTLADTRATSSFQPSIQTATPAIIKLDGAELGHAGKLPPDSTATHVRTVRNTASGPISLRVIKSTCACLKLDFDKSIPVGTHGSVRITAPVVGTPGEQAHWATFEASATATDGTITSAWFDIGVRYEADLTFVVEPSRLWVTAVRDVAIERRVYVRGLALDALNVRALRVEPPLFEASIGQRVDYHSEVNPGEAALPIVLRGTPAVSGLFDATLVFETSEPQFPIVRVPIQLRVREFWVAEPAGFAIIIAPGDATPIRRTLRVFARDGTPAPAARAELRDEQGRPLVIPILHLNLTPGTPEQPTTVEIEALPASLSDHGIAQVALLRADGTELRTIPLAWVKRLP
jgi:hypothetical protein